MNRKAATSTWVFLAGGILIVILILMYMWIMDKGGLAYLKEILNIANTYNNTPVTIPA